MPLLPSSSLNIFISDLQADSLLARGAEVLYGTGGPWKTLRLESSIGSKVTKEEEGERIVKA